MKVLIRMRWDIPWHDADGRDRFAYRASEDFQRSRWGIFTRYTLPSLRRQTHDDWECLLFADPALKAHHQTPPDQRVRWAYGGLTRDVEERTEDVYFMRMDSDDMLAPESMAMLVRLAPQVPRLYTQLDHGCAYDPIADCAYWWDNPSPPFYGRLWSGRDGSLPEFGHHVADREQAATLKTPRFAFCVLLHGGNISNQPDRSWCKPATIQQGLEAREVFRL